MGILIYIKLFKLYNYSPKWISKAFIQHFMHS